MVERPGSAGCAAKGAFQTLFHPTRVDFFFVLTSHNQQYILEHRKAGGKMSQQSKVKHFGIRAGQRLGLVLLAIVTGGGRF
jgi:hypothetical protein